MVKPLDGIASLREFRFRAGMSQRELAYRLMVSPSTISRWENGKLRPSAENLRLLAEALKVDTGEMLRNFRQVYLYQQIGERPRSAFRDEVTQHIGALTLQIMNHPEFESDRRDSVLVELTALQDHLLSLEEYGDESLPEKMAMMQASLREINHRAPQWVMDRVRAIFSEQAFAAYMGAAVGAALVKGLG